MRVTSLCCHILFTSIFFTSQLSCSPSKRGKSIIKSVQPSSHTIYRPGDKIIFSFKAETKYDSATLVIEGIKPIINKTHKSWSYTTPANQKIGNNNYKIVAYNNGASYEKKGVFKVYPKAPPKHTTLKLKKELPHSRTSYTQGLEFYNGMLYESNGEYGKSFLHIMEFPSMKVVKRVDMDDIYFAEGITILNDTLYQLTWRENVVFMYDAKTLDKIGQKSLATEGWGITNDGVNLYLTDGTSNIYMVEPSTFKTIRKFEVLTDKGVVGNINELEWIDGKIWANVYGYEAVLIIDPLSGMVERIANGSHLLSSGQRDETTDVFNGIAKDHKTGKIYVTGKNWPKLFEIEVEDDK